MEPIQRRVSISQKRDLSPASDIEPELDHRARSLALEKINRRIASNRPLEFIDLRQYLVAIYETDPTCDLSYDLRNASHFLQLYLNTPLTDDVEEDDPLKHYHPTKQPILAEAEIASLSELWRNLRPRISSDPALLSLHQFTAHLFILDAAVEQLLTAPSPLPIKTLIKLSSYPPEYSYKQAERNELFTRMLSKLLEEKPYLRPYFPDTPSATQIWLSHDSLTIENYINMLDLIRSPGLPSNYSRQFEALAKLAKTIIVEPFPEEDVKLHTEYYCRLLNRMKAIPDIYEEICFNVWKTTGEEAKPFIEANPLSLEVRSAIILASKGSRWYPPTMPTPRPIPAQIISTLWGAPVSQRFPIFTQLFHYPDTTTEQYKLAFGILSEEDKAAIREKAPMVDEWPPCWEIKRAVQLINAERKKELMS